MTRAVILFALVAFLFVAFSYDEPILNGDLYIANVLVQLGDDPPNHEVDFEIEGVSSVKGEELVAAGRTVGINGKVTSLQSKYFECTACHNIKKEDPDLANISAAARLTYAQEEDLPYLQGTSLYGAINRETFYNGDYDKKYGDLVKAARSDLREAIQLCAVECSQGRRLKDWELESILAYLWTIGLKINDIELTEEEMNQIKIALENGNEDENLVQLIKSKYALYSPATFADPPPNRKEGNGLEGVPSQGEILYDRSCQHCHYRNTYSFLKLDKSKQTLKYLRKKTATYHPHSTYQVVRYGTPPKSGKRAYMPQYPVEKMSEQQLADLISYFELASQ